MICSWELGRRRRTEDGSDDRREGEKFPAHMSERGKRDVALGADQAYVRRLKTGKRGLARNYLYYDANTATIGRNCTN